VDDGILFPVIESFEYLAKVEDVRTSIASNFID